MENLLEGAYDLHVHTGPDVMNRKLDDLEMAKRAIDAQMKGFAIKSHYFCSAERAKIVNKLYAGQVNALGAIVLNNSVGGLNPMAVEIAAKSKAKIVWFPTTDSKNEQDYFQAGKYEKLPFWASFQQELKSSNKEFPTITVLEDGVLKPEVLEILGIIRDYDLILATGHLGKEETKSVIKEGHAMGIKKIIVTHPNFPSIKFSIEEQQELARMGAYMEYCFTTPHSKKVSWESVFEEIRQVSPAHAILTTDLGQPNGLYPDEGLNRFAHELLESGFTKRDIQQLIVDNPNKLVEE